MVTSEVLVILVDKLLCLEARTVHLELIIYMIMEMILQLYSSVTLFDQFSLVVSSIKTWRA